mgnify:CR=1 FL=1
MNLSLFNTSLLGVIVVVSPAYAISTQDFVQTASIANEFEIESSQLALEKSQNSDVKKFAQRMVDDHTKTGEKMKEVLSSSDMKVKPADKLDNKHQKMLEKLKSASNDNFDRQYVSIQNEAHREAVDLFDSYSKSGKDIKLKGFASETLPTLKEHLEHVEQLKTN